jgi:peptidoglycan hydrolase CwlO-like protein
MSLIRRTAVLLLPVAAAFAALVASSSADLSSRYQSGQQRSAQLRAKINDETSQIDDYEGTIGQLRARLSALERSAAIQQQLLADVNRQLAAARNRLNQLRAQYAHDLVVLAAELRAAYETPPPTLVGVVVDSSGFNQLLNGLNDLTAIERHNTRTAESVRAARQAVKGETIALAQIQARRRRSTAAVVSERDSVAALKASIVAKELGVAHARDRDTSQLRALHQTLVHEARILDARAAAADTLSSGGAVAAPGGCVNTPFVPHGGEFGFFPAPGTNYGVNQEPIIAARLDQLGKALKLHLIGISGYRTPAHSVAVGGFADDPHTRGEASDTPGVEGVPESTLLKFCLTRPFPGPAEADHIQES